MKPRKDDMIRLSRRRLLQYTTGAAAGVATGGWTMPAANARLAGSATPVAGEAAVLDVAIIGGGVSGAYVAWRLLGPDADGSPLLGRLRAARGGALRVGLFEQSDRIGGRLWSVAPPGMPHLRAELGGMRVKNDQPLVLNLIRQLNLELVPFLSSGDNNLYYLRGHRFRQAQEPKAVPYYLPERFLGMNADDIVLAAIQQYVPDAATRDVEGWDAIRRDGTYDGVPLSSFGFWYLMNLALEQEAYAYVRDAAGYSDFTASVNAAELMFNWAVDFASNPEYHTLRDGLEALPRALAAGAETAGATINRRHSLRVLRMTPAPGEDEPLIELTFEVGPEAAPVVYQARHVVLALPRRAIELLDDSSFVFADASFRTLLETVRPVPAAKAFLGYDEPWWKELGIEGGRSITDLPIRQTYYFGTEGDQPGADPADRTSLLMATYDDEVNAAYWAGFLRQEPGSPGSAPYERSGVGPAPADAALSERAVAELQRQLRLIHGPSVAIGEPTMALFTDWGRDPYGGAWHFWNIGAQPWDIVPRTREPIPGVNLAICGEAYSVDQGWINGALLTAEQVLQQRFQLPWPASWLPAGTRLGP
jgi:monoamine oxidase